ncbi:hypothetical protein ACYG9R_10660 [Mesorhizobium sp. RSR565B]|uniref:hypothetical protein n=1 Tax=Mesorhizobium sp. L103C565B0 TaxID=1287094 RepID=UPI0003D03239|nr:hypothetical protein [Mesorhizobium sp. L103C565B0]ESZ50999.1 hypothetical protein X730_13520 [Mesorhizobium sp. L103C565B0]
MNLPQIYLQPTATIVSAFLGFFFGALFNHYLSNRRKQRETDEGVVALIQTVIADLGSISLQVAIVRDILAVRAGVKKSVTLGEESAFDFTLLTLKNMDFSHSKYFIQRMPMIGWETLSAVLSQYRDAQAMTAMALQAVEGQVELKTFLDSFDGFNQDAHMIENNLFLLQVKFLNRSDYRAHKRQYYKDFHSALADGRTPDISKERLDKAFNRRWPFG